MLKKILDRIMYNGGKLFMPSLADLEKGMVSGWGSRDNSITNPVTQVIVAGVNTFTYPITVVTTNAAMTGITVPYASFQGRITLLPITTIFTWTAAGNIALAGSAVIGKALDFVYNPVTGKWYPSYIA